MELQTAFWIYTVLITVIVLVSIWREIREANQTDTQNKIFHERNLIEKSKLNLETQRFLFEKNPIPKAAASAGKKISTVVGQARDHAAKLDH